MGRFRALVIDCLEVAAVVAATAAGVLIAAAALSGCVNSAMATSCGSLLTINILPGVTT